MTQTTNGFETFRVSLFGVCVSENDTIQALVSLDSGMEIFACGHGL